MEQKLSQLVQGLFDVKLDVQVSRPDKQFGDYATNVAMQLAGKLGQNPRQIADQLVAALQETGEYSEVSVAGPGFINLRLDSAKLATSLSEQWSDKYGENDDGAGKTVIVEYPSPNMAKPYSIGHLRPGNQGWAAKRLMEVTGWRVVTDNHLGDYGAPFGVWVVGFLNYSSQAQLDEGGVYELGRIYIATKQALKEEKDSGTTKLADEVQDWLIKLENSDPAALDYARRFKQISLAHIHEIMERLKISTDHELGEAFFAPKGKLAVQQLLEAGTAKQNPDGSIIVPLDDYGFDVPLLVQKSNGAALYATTDLATILYREAEFQPDRVIYAAGSEQQFYFSQLFALSKKIGIQTELIHLWFGMIDQLDADGTRQKMSSRQGVVLMEDLLDKAEDKAREVVAEREISPADIKKIALGAVKFSDFTADRRTNILFDWDSIFALTGFSGPYVQYASVRVGKILASNDRPAVDTSGYDYQPEKDIILKLLDYPSVVRLAARELEPHKIANYLYELAREMNRYYEKTPVATGDATEVQTAARLDVLTKVRHVFAHGLSILGIEIPEAM